jgi:hypothetical protein
MNGFPELSINFIELSTDAYAFDAVTYNIWINADAISTWARIITYRGCPLCGILYLFPVIVPELFIHAFKEPLVDH